MAGTLSAAGKPAINARTHFDLRAMCAAMPIVAIARPTPIQKNRIDKTFEPFRNGWSGSVVARVEYRQTAGRIYNVWHCLAGAAW